MESTAASPIDASHLACGARLVTERILGARSVSVCWLVPVGIAGDPPANDSVEDRDGATVLCSELVMRGAGARSSRAFSDACDALGMLRRVSPAAFHTRVAFTTTGPRLADSLALAASMVREPTFADEALEPVRALALQAIDGLADDPHAAVMVDLQRRHAPPPFNRSTYGTRSTIESIGIDALRDHWHAGAVPHGSIIGVAGDVDHAHAAATLDELLSGWTGSTDEPAPTGPAARGVEHIERETSQTHLALALDAPPETDPTHLALRLGVVALGGATSSRLFTEVRERRGLCYAIGASYAAGRDRGAVSIYAGTTPERVGDTRERIGIELDRIVAGITPEELDRARIGVKSRLVMQGESASARAGALASDLFVHGRPRGLTERAVAIDAVSLDEVNAALASTFATDRVAGATHASIGPA